MRIASHASLLARAKLRDSFIPVALVCTWHYAVTRDPREK